MNFIPSIRFSSYISAIAAPMFVSGFLTPMVFKGTGIVEKALSLISDTAQITPLNELASKCVEISQNEALKRTLFVYAIFYATTYATTRYMINRLFPPQHLPFAVTSVLGLKTTTAVNGDGNIILTQVMVSLANDTGQRPIDEAYIDTYETVLVIDGDQRHVARNSHQRVSCFLQTLRSREGFRQFLGEHFNDPHNR